MTFVSGNPNPVTPESKLADKNWRLLNSWWILPPVLSCSFLCWLGFLVAAIRTGKKKYWIFTAVYTSVLIVFFTLTAIADGDSTSVASKLAIAPLLIAWFGPTIHAALLNREYLRTIAAKGAWYQTPANQAGSVAAQAAAPPFLGVSNAHYYGPNASAGLWQQPAPAAPPHRRPLESPPATAEGHLTSTRHTSPPPGQSHHPTETGSIHANTVTADTLSQLPGVSPALAQRVVAVRDARGGYRNIEDLAAAANLQPHELIRLRGHLIFDEGTTTQSPDDDPGPRSGTGRILDI